MVLNILRFEAIDIGIYVMRMERSAIVELFRHGKTTEEILKILEMPLRYNETGSLSDNRVQVVLSL